MLSCSRIVDIGVFALFTKGGHQLPGQQRHAAATTLIFQTSPCSYSVSAAAKSHNWRSALISEGEGSPGGWAPLWGWDVPAVQEDLGHLEDSSWIHSSSGADEKTPQFCSKHRWEEIDSEIGTSRNMEKWRQEEGNGNLIFLCTLEQTPTPKMSFKNEFTLWDPNKE